MFGASRILQGRSVAGFGPGSRPLTGLSLTGLSVTGTAIGLVLCLGACSTPPDPFAPPAGFRAGDQRSAASDPASGGASSGSSGPVAAGGASRSNPAGTPPANPTTAVAPKSGASASVGDQATPSVEAPSGGAPSGAASAAEAVSQPAAPIPPIVEGTDLLTTVRRQIAAIKAKSGPRGLEALQRGVDRPTRLRFGFARMSIGRLKDAEAVFEALLDRDADDAVAGIGAAQTALLSGELDAGRRHFERALRSSQATRSVTQAASIGLAQIDLYSSAEADVERGRRRLRELLVTGSPAEPALLLANSLADTEQLDEARAALQAGLARAPGSYDLRFALARVEVDLGALEAAAKTLRELRQEVTWPNVAIELAVVERMLGRLTEARQLYEEVLARADDPIVRQQRKMWERELQMLIEEEKAGRRLYLVPREALSNLRNHESATTRLRAFETLARRTRSPSDLRRFLRIARSDEDASVRISALRVGASVTDDLESWVRDGLTDAEAEVRAAAAALAGPLAVERAGPMVLAALEKEADGYAFRELFEVLNKVTGQSRFLPTGAEDDAKQRAAAVAQWSDWRTKWAK